MYLIYIYNYEVKVVECIKEPFEHNNFKGYNIVPKDKSIHEGAPYTGLSDTELIISKNKIWCENEKDIDKCIDLLIKYHKKRKKAIKKQLKSVKLTISNLKEYKNNTRSAI